MADHRCRLLGDRARGLTPGQVTSAMWGFASLGYTPNAFLRAVDWPGVCQSASFKQVASLAWSAAVVGQAGAAIGHAALRRLCGLWDPATSQGERMRWNLNLYLLSKVQAIVRVPIAQLRLTVAKHGAPSCCRALAHAPGSHGHGGSASRRRRPAQSPFHRAPVSGGQGSLGAAPANPRAPPVSLPGAQCGV